MSDHCQAPRCAETVLCNAHIIPAGFARTLSKHGGFNLALSAAGSKRAKHQHGYFDPTILCAGHDGHLGRFDEAAIAFCANLPMTPTARTGTLFRGDVFDGEAFATFALAVIWRASISRRPEWAAINLGRYEDIVANILFSEASLHDHAELEVVLLRYASSRDDTRRYTVNPLSIRSGALNVFTFSAGGFLLYVKVDQRPIDMNLRPFVINRMETLVCPIIQFEDSADFKYFRGVHAVDRTRGSRPAS